MTNAEKSSDGLDSRTRDLISHISNLPNFFLVQYRTMVSLASHLLSSRLTVARASFRVHISKIIRLRPCEQMTRIDTSHVIAMMKGMKPVNVFDSANKQRESVGVIGFPVEAKVAVSSALDSTNPSPTFSKLRPVFWNWPVLINAVKELIPLRFTPIVWWHSGVDVTNLT